MGHFLKIILLSVFINSISLAAYTPSINTLAIGNQNYKASGVVSLHCNTNVSASKGICTFRKHGATSGYLGEGTGTGYIILGFRLTSSSAGAIAIGAIGCSSNDVGYETNTTATYTSEFFKGIGTANIMLPGTFYRSLGLMTLMDEYAFPDSSSNGFVCANNSYVTVTGSSSAANEVGYQLWVRPY